MVARVRGPGAGSPGALSVTLRIWPSLGKAVGASEQRVTEETPPAAALGSDHGEHE